jgi:hypothetical protein
MNTAQIFEEINMHQLEEESRALRQSPCLRAPWTFLSLFVAQRAMARIRISSSPPCGLVPPRGRNRAAIHRISQMSVYPKS